MNPLTITQVNTYIKAILDEATPLKNIYLCGEISNFLHYFKSGHMYFTLKDEKSQIKAVMFSSYAQRLKFVPENGMKVVCFGRISAYEKDGIYQIYVQDMQPQGVGSLTVAYEQLKKDLELKGYFDESHKKAIPKYPKKIGVATSNMGAAVEDIKNILARRFPMTEVVIAPTLVQGENAAPDIAKSIELLDNMHDIDLIIVGRGGGSIEDLWAFNTQIVADAVYNCNTPIISAVGHETDYTICDFIADLRAPTPSAAAELAVPDFKNELVNINNLSITLEKQIDSFIAMQEKIIDNYKNNSIIANAVNIFDSLNSNVNNSLDKLNFCYSNVLFSKEKQLASCIAKLEALSPLAVLSRGYSLTMLNERTVKSVKDIKRNDSVSIKFSDGYANATINEVVNNEK